MSENQAFRTNLPAEFLRRGYVLLSRLGRGATSEVFEARHRPTSRSVALKVALGDIADSARVSARLETAWNVGRGLRHPHLVATFDGGRLPDGRAWIAMERLVGRDLQGELDDVGRLAPPRAVHIARQVFEALMVLHRRGAIHRDVKPENVFLCGSGGFQDHVRLIDLGVLAIAADDPKRAHELTGPMIMGTPLYLAPELARGDRPTPAIDLYSAAALLFHLLEGQPPYPGEEPTEVIKLHLVEPIPELSPALAIPPELRDLIRRCLAKYPSERPPDAAFVVAALDQCLLAMAGGSEAREGLQEAMVPGVPPVGVGPEWVRFSDALLHNIRLGWRGTAQPPELAAGVEWLAAARRTLEEAEATAEERRAFADHQARARIEARARLRDQLDQLDQALGEARSRLAEATTRVDEVARERDALDERYRADVQRLHAIGERPLGEVAPAAIVPVAVRVRELLALRNEIEQRLLAARDAEREAAEQVALLLAERVEVQRVEGDLELEEQDEGQRAELLAGRTRDIAASARRAFENASLNLYLRYVQRATAMATPAPGGPFG